MGWHDLSIPLRQIGESPQSERKVDEATRKLFGQYFRAHLPRSWSKKTPRWFDWGLDSLVKLHEPDESPSDQRLDELSFWFHDTAAWPVSLARHWVLTALRDASRCGLFSMLRTHGYALAEGASLPARSSVFLSSGTRLGRVREDGVEWQDDTPVFVADADLTEALRAQVVAARESGTCACPLCATSGLLTPEQLQILADCGDGTAAAALRVEPADRSFSDWLAAIADWPPEARVRAALAAFQQALAQKSPPELDGSPPQKVASAVDKWLSSPETSHALQLVSSATHACEEEWRGVRPADQPARLHAAATHLGWAVMGRGAPKASGASIQESAALDSEPRVRKEAQQSVLTWLLQAPHTRYLSPELPLETIRARVEAAGAHVQTKESWASADADLRALSIHARELSADPSWPADLRCQYLEAAGDVHTHFERHSEAVPIRERLLDAEKEAGTPAIGIAWTQIALSRSLIALKRYDEAIAAAVQAQVVAEDCDERRSRYQIALSGGHHLRNVRPGPAAELFQRAVELAATTDALAWMLFRRGYALALALLRAPASDRTPAAAAEAQEVLGRGAIEARTAGEAKLAFLCVWNRAEAGRLISDNRMVFDDYVDALALAEKLGQVDIQTTTIHGLSGDQTGFRIPISLFSTIALRKTTRPPTADRGAGLLRAATVLANDKHTWAAACAAAEACRELVSSGLPEAEVEARLAPVWAPLHAAGMAAEAQAAAWDVPVDWVSPLTDAKPSGRSVLTTLATEPWASGLHRLVKPFVGAGLRVNRLDDNGHTALTLACLSARPKLVRALLEAGADPKLADTDGRWPLLIASGRCVYCTKALLKAGADPTQVGIIGQGPLHHATAHGRQATVRALVEAGAKPLSSREGKSLRDTRRVQRNRFTIAPELRNLEALLGRTRLLNSLGLTLDSYERWGKGSDPALKAKSTRQLADRDAVTAELTALSKQVRVDDPAAVARWSQAHIALLEDFLTRVEGDSTAAYVANEEIEAWGEVAAGKRDFVDPNVHFIRPNPATYRRLFEDSPT